MGVQCEKANECSYEDCDHHSIHNENDECAVLECRWKGCPVGKCKPVSEPLKDIMEQMERELRRIADPEDTSAAAELYRIVRVNDKKVFIKIIMESGRCHGRTPKPKKKGEPVMTSRTINIS